MQVAIFGASNEFSSPSNDAFCSSHGLCPSKDIPSTRFSSAAVPASATYPNSIAVGGAAVQQTHYMYISGPSNVISGPSISISSPSHGLCLSYDRPSNDSFSPSITGKQVALEQRRVAGERVSEQHRCFMPQRFSLSVHRVTSLIRNSPPPRTTIGL